ncbi:chorismate-binding protein [Lysinibacillus sp. 54212]|uniref:chorismate-binding protein n=1 Tax=Lysinibacillus sp. 54212 TaxID=3119829 RepID=UPI002FC65B2A
MYRVGFRTVVKKMNGDSITPILIIRRLQGQRKFLLEGSRQFQGSGDYTYIGVNPLVSVVGSGDQLVETNHYTGKTTIHNGDPLGKLKEIMPEFSNDLEYPFIGGAIGYVSYDGMSGGSSKECEINIPDIVFDFYDSIIIFDHKTEEVIFIHHEIQRTFEEANIDSLIHQVFLSKEEESGRFELSPFESRMTEAEYSKLIKAAQQYIKSGQVIQLVLSKRLIANFSGDSFALYRKLRKETPAPSMYYFQYSDYVIVGVSPESIVKIDGSRVVISPVTGAKPRGATPREDMKVELNLLQSGNEVSAHNIMVDTCTQDLEKICLPNSIRLIDYMKPVQFKHTIRLTTDIEGTLLPMSHPIDALRALLPPASSSGVPKITAAQIVNEIEPVARSFYGGAIGYFSLNGNVNFTLLQQSMLIKDQRAYIQAGANVLTDTIEEEAIVETRKKIKAFLSIDNTNE